MNIENEKMNNYSTSAFYLREQLQKGGEDEDVLVTNAGVSVEHFTELHYRYGDDNHDYLLVYQHKGSVKFTVDGKRRTVSDGGFVIIPPEHLRELYYAGDETNERHYVYFKGKKLREIFAELSLPVADDRPTYFNTGVAAEAIGYIRSILNDFKLNPFDHPLRRSIALMNLLSLVADRIAVAPDSISVMPAVKAMESSPFAERTLKDYAALCHMSEQTFIRHFKREMHCPPWQFVESIKINQIKNLLSSTTNSISDIAAVCNFFDPFYFSRFFKKHVGISPLAYRKQTQTLPPPAPQAFRLSPARKASQKQTTTKTE